MANSPQSPATTPTRRQVRDRALARVSSAVLSVRLLSMLLLTVLSTGCVAVPNSYLASELPQEYEAPPNVNTKTIDFSKLSGSPVNTDEIGPGDQLEVCVSAGVSGMTPLVFPVRVASNGFGNVDAMGPIRLVGLELDEAEQVIRQQGMRMQLYVNPRVTVAMKRKKVHQIMVVGAVKDPGQKTIPASQANLLNAIFAAGGLTDDAGRNVEITNLVPELPMPEAIASGERGGVTQTGYSTGLTRSARIDLVKATQQGTNAYYIGDGGVVHVEKRDPKAIHVAGLVRKPGRIDFPINQDLHLFEALALAGHTTTQIADKVYVFRQMPGQERVRIQCSLAKAKRSPVDDIRLAPGDILQVEHTPATVLLEALQVIRFAVTSSVSPIL